MPLSFFSAFWAAQDRGRPGGRREAEAFGRFSLLAFVLYDPREDAALHRRLQGEWEILDGLTGEHLLFFAPVDPPAAWIADPDFARWGSMRLIRKRVAAAPDRLSRERSYAPLVSRDPSQTSASFRQMLGVPAGIGSCLVIARSLQDEQVWLLSTDASRVGPQLERLGSLASLAARQSMPRQAVEPYIARIAGEADAIIEALPLPASLAAVLTDVCAMTAAQGVVRETRDALTQDRALAQLRKSADERTRIYHGVDPDMAIRTLVQAGAVLAAGSATQPEDRLEVHAYRMYVADSDEEPWPFPKPPANSRTAQLLRMGDDCLRQIMAGQIGDRDDPDYRVAVAAWSQALEHEMAELLGHEVRAGLGVMLPQFHWRRQPGLHSIEIACASLSGPIPFNQARPNSPDPDRALWQPPAMGPLRLGWEAWRASNGKPAPRELIELLLRCKDFRNAASHAGEQVRLETAREAQVAMKRAIGMIAGLGIRSWAGGGVIS